MSLEKLLSLLNHYEWLIENRNQMDMLEMSIDFRCFRDRLADGLGNGEGSRDGRPPFYFVPLFEAVIAQHPHNLSNYGMELLIRDCH